MPKDISLDEVGSDILINAAQSVILMELASLKINFMSSCCEALYQGIMNEKQEELFRLEQNSHKWHEDIKYRITGSRCYEIYTYGGIDWGMKSKKDFWPKSFTNKYVKHGQMYEKSARECFLSQTGYEVIVCGVVLTSDRKPIALLEIKCLYSGT